MEGHLTLSLFSLTMLGYFVLYIFCRNPQVTLARKFMTFFLNNKTKFFVQFDVVFLVMVGVGFSSGFPAQQDLSAPVVFQEGNVQQVSLLLSYLV